MLVKSRTTCSPKAVKVCVGRSGFPTRSFRPSCAHSDALLTASRSPKPSACTCLRRFASLFLFFNPRPAKALSLTPSNNGISLPESGRSEPAGCLIHSREELGCFGRKAEGGEGAEGLRGRAGEKGLTRRKAASRSWHPAKGSLSRPGREAPPSSPAGRKEEEKEGEKEGEEPARPRPAKISSPQAGERASGVQSWRRFRATRHPAHPRRLPLEGAARPRLEGAGSPPAARAKRPRLPASPGRRGGGGGDACAWPGSPPRKSDLRPPGFF